MYENPFFIREVRQLHSRLLLWTLAVTGSMGVGLLGLLVLWHRFVAPARMPPPLLGLLLGLHGLCCMAAGAYGADRVFGEEHRRDTLDGLLLLPLKPGAWLGGKVVLPLYVVGLTWLAGLPVYLLAATLNFATFPSLADGSLAALAAGWLMLPAVLILPPDYRERLRRLRSGVGSRTQKIDPDLMVRSALLYLAMLTVMLAVAGRSLTAGVPARLYALAAPGWAVWPVAGAVFLAAALVSARATAAGEEGAERTAARVRLAVLTLLYYLDAGAVLGMFWGVSPPWMKVALIAGLPSGILMARRLAGQPREDPLSGAELDWAARRWDDPLLLKDLRVLTRFTSVRASILREAAVLVALFGGLAYLMLRSGSTLVDLADGATGMLLSVTPILLTVEASLRPFTTWTRERAAGTLPFLFVSPLRSEEILWGRLRSALLYTVLVHLPLILLTLVALLRVLYLGPGVPAVVAGAAASPLALLFIVALGCAIRPQNLPPWKWRREDFLEIPLGLAQVGTLMGCVAVGFFAEDRLGRACLLALALLGLNAGIAWACYRLRLRVLNALRAGDAELPES